MVSLAPYVLKRPWLTKMLTPAANWYASAAGYRQLGLRYEPNPFKAFLRGCHQWDGRKHDIGQWKEEEIVLQKKNCWYRIGRYGTRPG